MMLSLFTVFTLILNISGVFSQCVLYRNTVFSFSGSDCGRRCIDRFSRNAFCEYKPFKTGCFCKPGYYRDLTFNCVRDTQCPRRGTEQINERKSHIRIYGNMACRLNELYTDCGNWCTEKCRNLGKDNCPLNRCDKGCFCKDGFWRDDKGECVAMTRCGVKLTMTTTPLPIICPYGEVFDKCGKRCHENCHGSITECAQEACKKGCYCRAGYRRDIKGNCVPAGRCSPRWCGWNEDFRLCGSKCAELCDPPLECPGTCTPGCFCKVGYYRNDKNQCGKDEGIIGLEIHRAISERYTDRCQNAVPRVRKGKDMRCEQNEEFRECGTRCKEDCESLFKSITCPYRKFCVTGCFCQKGFYRNDNDKCVSAQNCQKPESDPAIRKSFKCRGNEEFNDCGNKCTELCNAPRICDDQCDPGCYCKSGYFRDEEDNCVKEKDCDFGRKTTPVPISEKFCGNNQKYNDCRPNCVQTCAEMGEKVCPKRKRCNRGCYCIEGFLRDDFGNCVHNKKCGGRGGPEKGKTPKVAKKKKKNDPDEDEPKNEFPSCAKNEDYQSCGDYCIEMCNPPRKCPRKCISGCFCSPGYLRDERGNCVPKEKCPNYRRPRDDVPEKRCKGQNTQWNPCGTTCGQTCKEQSRFVECPLMHDCESACFCYPGHYRDKHGDCVPLGDCDPPVGEYKRPPMRSTTQKPEPKCKVNQHFEECGDHCVEMCSPADSCEEQCEPGCFCNKGFYRAEGAKGPCVPEKRCPANDDEEPTKVKIKIKLKCNQNEYYTECGTRCGQTCEDQFKKSLICPKKGLCVGGCFCRDGFNRNSNGKCIPSDQCEDTRPTPKHPYKCDANEVYNKCGDRCRQSCETKFKTIKCPDNQCSAGCFCKEGYLKDMYGNCVKEDDCPEPIDAKPKDMKCDENELFLECGYRCGQSCDEVLQKKNCTKMKSCLTGCFCQRGYYRDNKGFCIPKDECTKDRSKSKIKCDANEEYSACSMRCAQGCDDLGQKVDCPKEKHCASGCFCKEGYLHDENGNCVPEGECPDIGPPSKIPRKYECGENEEYNECGTRCGQGCEELARRVSCPKRRICISGCFCTEGYFRDDTGLCVPILDCSELSPPKRPPPACDQNEEHSECGHRCGQSCDDYTSNKKCPKKQSCVTGCFCVEGHMRNEKGECVPQDKCKERKKLDSDFDPKDIKCEKNEEYMECSTRCGQGCEDLAHPADCAKDQMCVSGCFCVVGYYRNELGECVPESKCPDILKDSKDKKCGKNEIFTDCGSHCGQRCEDVNSDVMCPRKRMCITGCFCKKGFFRDKDDNCIPQRQCLHKSSNGKDSNDSDKPLKAKNSDDIKDSGERDPKDKNIRDESIKEKSNDSDDIDKPMKAALDLKGDTEREEKSSNEEKSEESDDSETTTKK